MYIIIVGLIILSCSALTSSRFTFSVTVSTLTWLTFSGTIWPDIISSSESSDSLVIDDISSESEPKDSSFINSRIFGKSILLSTIVSGVAILFSEGGAEGISESIIFESGAEGISESVSVFILFSEGFDKVRIISEEGIFKIFSIRFNLDKIHASVDSLSIMYLLKTSKASSIFFWPNKNLSIGPSAGNSLVGSSTFNSLVGSSTGNSLVGSSTGNSLAGSLSDFLLGSLSDFLLGSLSDFLLGSLAGTFLTGSFLLGSLTGIFLTGSFLLGSLTGTFLTGSFLLGSLAGTFLTGSLVDFLAGSLTLSLAFSTGSSFGGGFDDLTRVLDELLINFLSELLDVLELDLDKFCIEGSFFSDLDLDKSLEVSFTGGLDRVFKSPDR